MDIINSYNHTVTEQRVHCYQCNKDTINPYNPKWVVPCTITYHCRDCDNSRAIRYVVGSNFSHALARFKNHIGLE